MSLRARVLAGVALIAVVLGVVMVVITRNTEANLLDQVDEQLVSAIRPMRGLDLDGDGRPLPRGPRMGPPERLSSLYVGAVDGDAVRTVAAPNLSGDDTPLPDIAAPDALAAAETGEPFTVDSTGSDLRYRVLGYRSPRAGTVVVLALPLDSVDDAVANLVTVGVIGAAVILVTLGLVAWWVIRLGIRPVKRMTGAATAIAAGDLSQRVPEAEARTEAGELGIALNQMLGRIEDAFDERARTEDRLRQFVADASHELRTPVATIRGYSELYRTGALDEPDALADAMRRTEQEAIRMGALVDDLFLLARLDQGRPLESEQVDLGDLARDAAADARAVDPGRRVDADTDGAGALVVRGDEARLRQVFANVMGNALVHTPPGTPVQIRARRDDGRAVVEITDRGPGMTDEVAAHAFERFFRADPARSRHRGGSGLGLAIVDATVRAHRGTVSLRTAPGDGTTVRFEIPVDA